MIKDVDNFLPFQIYTGDLDKTPLSNVEKRFIQLTRGFFSNTHLNGESFYNEIKKELKSLTILELNELKTSQVVRNYLLNPHLQSTLEVGIDNAIKEKNYFDSLDLKLNNLNEIYVKQPEQKDWVVSNLDDLIKNYKVSLRLISVYQAGKNLKIYPLFLKRILNSLDPSVSITLFEKEKRALILDIKNEKIEELNPILFETLLKLDAKEKKEGHVFNFPYPLQTLAYIIKLYNKPVDELLKLQENATKENKLYCDWNEINEASLELGLFDLHSKLETVIAHRDSNIDYTNFVARLLNMINKNQQVFEEKLQQTLKVQGNDDETRLRNNRNKFVAEMVQKTISSHLAQANLKDFVRYCHSDGISHFQNHPHFDLLQRVSRELLALQGYQVVYFDHDAPLFLKVSERNGLACKSTFFKSIVAGSFKESELKNPIYIKDFDSSTIKSIFYHILYNKPLPENWGQLFCIASFFGLEETKTKLQEQFAKLIAKLSLEDPEQYESLKEAYLFFRDRNLEFKEVFDAINEKLMNRINEILIEKLDDLPSFKATLDAFNFYNFENLDFYDCEKFKDEHLKLICHLPLKSLELHKCQITDAGLLYLANMTSLEELSLNYIETIQDFSPLKNLGNLKKLSADGTAILESLEDLGDLEFEELSLIGCNLSDEQLRLINPTRLKKLYVPYNYIREGLDHLGKAPLEELNLIGNIIQPESLKSLLKTPNLVFLRLGDNGDSESSPDLLPALQDFLQLRRLELIADDNLDFSKIAHLPLQYLLLESCYETREFSKLPQFPLNTLILDRGSVNDETLKSISKIETLENLSLRNLLTDKTRLSEKGINLLTSLKGLKNLFIHFAPKKVGVEYLSIDEILNALQGIKLDTLTLDNCGPQSAITTSLSKQIHANELLLGENDMIVDKKDVEMEESGEMEESQISSLEDSKD